MHYFGVHPISTTIFRRLTLLYCYTPPVAGEEGRGLKHITLRKLPFPCFSGFPSVLHSQGYGRKKLHRSSQPTKGKIVKISNTADNGRHQLPSFSDIKKTSSAFNLQFMNVTD